MNRSINVNKVQAQVRIGQKISYYVFSLLQFCNIVITRSNKQTKQKIKTHLVAVIVPQ